MLPQNQMQNYVESRLTSLHNLGSTAVSNSRDKFVAFIVGALVVFSLPYLHIGVFYRLIWVPGKPKIDRISCTCNCFDTVFRGSYENPGNIPYKHVYFNATWQTSRIWLFTVIFILLGYESIKYLIPLIRRNQIRSSMLFLYVVNLYPNYYSWWSYFSYYNEDFYTYFKHHMLFTVTEIVATCLVLNMCDIRNEIQSWKMIAISSINLMHILVSGMDQFITHVIQGRGTNFQNARDLGLMIPDFLHVIVPILCLLMYARGKDIRLNELCYKEEIMLSCVFVTLCTLLGRLM